MTHEKFEGERTLMRIHIGESDKWHGKPLYDAIVEMLRKEKISVYHSITKDKITGQLNGAEYMKATHVLIIGQKEAIENTVVVRDVISREQDTVPLANLADFLKKL